MSVFGVILYSVFSRRRRSIYVLCPGEGWMYWVYSKLTIEIDVSCEKSKLLLLITLHKKCHYSELFWSVFSRIRTKCGYIIRISPNSIWIRITPNRNTFCEVFYSTKVAEVVNQRCSARKILFRNIYMKASVLESVFW